MQADENVGGQRPQHRFAYPYISRRVLMPMGAGLIVVVLASGGYLLLHRPNPIPAAIRQASSFPIYYPANPAPNTVLKAGSVHASNGVVVFDLTNNSSHQNIQVTQQPLPPKFDPKVTFQHANLPTAVSPIGTIYDLSFKDQSRFMITTTSSLIFISSTPKITDGQLQSIVNGLKASK